MIVFEVKWYKGSWFKAIINSSSNDAAVTFYSLWVKMAREKLQTEMPTIERQRLVLAKRQAKATAKAAKQQAKQQAQQQRAAGAAGGAKRSGASSTKSTSTVSTDATRSKGAGASGARGTSGARKSTASSTPRVSRAPPPPHAAPLAPSPMPTAVQPAPSAPSAAAVSAVPFGGAASGAPPATAGAPVYLTIFGVRLRRSTVWLSSFILLLLAFVFYLNVRVWTLETEVSQWHRDYAQLEDRVIFLQVFASRMAQYVQEVRVWVAGSSSAMYSRVCTQDGKDIMESEWEYWQKSNGIEWKLAEWTQQLTSLHQQVSGALDDGINLLQEIQNKRLANVGPLDVLSERHLAQMLEQQYQGQSDQYRERVRCSSKQTRERERERERERVSESE